MAIEIPKPPQGAWLKRKDNIIVLGAILKNGSVFFSFFQNAVLSGVIFNLFYSITEYGYMFLAFMAPFVFMSIVLWKEFFLTLFGKVEIRLYEKEGIVFTGIYKIGFTQKFVYKNVKAIQEVITETEEGTQNYSIKIEEEKIIKFAKDITDERRVFIIEVV